MFYTGSIYNSNFTSPDEPTCLRRNSDFRAAHRGLHHNLKYDGPQQTASPVLCRIGPVNVNKLPTPTNFLCRQWSFPVSISSGGLPKRLVEDNGSGSGVPSRPTKAPAQLEPSANCSEHFECALRRAPSDTRKEHAAFAQDKMLEDTTASVTNAQMNSCTDQAFHESKL
ncbi:hypothetical protein ACEPAH_6356 [Sanghuangporus vaninii]